MFRATRLAWWLSVAVVVSLNLALAERVWCAETPAELLYRSEDGQTAAYQVTITADLDDYVETFQGEIAFNYHGMFNDQLKVTYEGCVGRSRKNKPVESDEFPGFPFPPGFGLHGPTALFGRGIFRGLSQTTNDLTLTPRGEIKSIRGTSQLPYLLGNLSVMLFEPLPEKAESQWSVDLGAAVAEGGQGRRPYFPPAAYLANGEQRTAATEKLSYAIQSDDGPLVKVEKTYEFSCPASSEDDAGFEIHGSGTWTFNRELGVSESLDFKQKLTVSEGNSTTIVPMTIAYRRLSPEEWEKIKKERAEAAEKGREMARRMAEQRNTPEGQREADLYRQAHEALRSRDRVKIEAAIKALNEQMAGKDDPSLEGLKRILEHVKATVRPNEGAAARSPARSRRSTDGEYRTWSDDSGTFSVEAKYVSSDEDRVTLMRKDGRQVQVPLDRLSEADREFVEKRRHATENPFEP